MPLGTAGGQHAEQGVEHPEACGHQGGQTEQGSADGLPQRCGMRGTLGCGRREELDDGQQRDDQQVLEQQDGNDALATRRGQFLFLGKKHEVNSLDIYFDKDEKLIVELKILIRFGTSIRNTSEQLLREIKDEIESKCGIEISNVDIAVRGMYSGRKMNYTKH